MGYSLPEYLTAQFYKWELRGRGWAVFEEPVHLEPDFVPFFGHYPPFERKPLDLGRRPRFFPKLQEALGLFEKPVRSFDDTAFAKLDEQYPLQAYTYENPDPVSEFQINFDKDTRIPFEYIDQLLIMLSTSDGIVGFEILGTGERITIQFVCTSSDSVRFKSFLTTYIPGVFISETPNYLQSLIDPDQTMWLIDLGLRDEFMRPLRVWNKFDPDPLLGCLSALEAVSEGELGMLQVLFQPAVNPWVESIYRAVTDGDGGGFFTDAPEMLPLTKDKASSPLFSTVIRVVGQSTSATHAQALAGEIVQGLVSFHRTGSNTLIPLEGPASADIEDFLMRRSRRIGMLLNSHELASIAHIPVPARTASAKLLVNSGKTKKSPAELSGHAFELGINTHLEERTTVTLSDQHRLRHMHLIGATGTGKSSMLLKFITQDVTAGNGVAVLDPHGDLIDGIIRHLPQERLKDVILVDPSDGEYPVGLNLLSASSEGEKIILSSDLVALFRRFATSWGDQMTSVLSNAVNAMLESKTGGTLIDLRRFLVEPGFRNNFLESVEDPNIQYYWKHEFQLLRPGVTAPILTRLDTFLRPRIIRHMMAQKDGLDFRNVLDTRKILLVKLAQGLIGEENSYLLGTLFVTKLQQAAQSRQNISAEQRTPFYLYIDEFQHFVTPSMSAILSGARKYGLGLILAHQDLDQLVFKDAELANSVLSNPYTRICFRCGDKDATRLESSFSFFDASDLQNLPIGHAIARVGQKDHDFNLTFDLLPVVDPNTSEGHMRFVVAHCRSTYGLHQREVEKILSKAYDIGAERTKPAAQPAAEKPLPDTQRELPKTQEIKEPPLAEELESQAQRFTQKEVQREELREHRFLQQFVKQIGEARNFKASIEEPVNDGGGKVDVSLLRDELRIACEISVTNTAEYEVQNIEKCLASGYTLIYMISNDPNHLSAIRSLAVTMIDSVFHPRIHFVSQDDFVSHLDLFLAQQTRVTETRAKGYRVKVNFSGSSDPASQEKALKDVIVGAMRRKEKEEE